jgi:hypothetical protein
MYHLPSVRLMSTLTPIRIPPITLSKSSVIFICVREYVHAHYGQCSRALIEIDITKSKCFTKTTAPPPPSLLFSFFFQTENCLPRLPDEKQKNLTIFTDSLTGGQKPAQPSENNSCLILSYPYMKTLIFDRKRK